MDEPQEANLVEELQQEPADPGDEFSWESSEFIYHRKGTNWYVMLFIVVALLIVVAVMTKQWLSIAVFATMLGALLVHSNRPPRTLTYHIGSQGVTVGEHFYPYSQFRSFAVLQDVAWHAIDLEPTMRFMPRLTLMVDDDHRDQIIDILSNFLPEEEREPDIIDKLARKLKF